MEISRGVWYALAAVAVLSLGIGLVAGLAQSAPTSSSASANAGPASPAPVREIRPGSAGVGVLCVQRALNFSDHARLTVDGQDGPRTTAAVERFQRRRGLAPTGIVNETTGAAIYAIDDEFLHQGSECSAAVPRSLTLAGGAR